MSLHGMVRHLADVERNWFQRVLGRRPGLPAIFLSDEAPDADWGPLDGADWADDLAAWQHAIAPRVAQAGIEEVLVQGRLAGAASGDNMANRSTPAAQPMPGVDGPPIISMSPS